MYLLISTFFGQLCIVHLNEMHMLIDFFRIYDSWFTMLYTGYELTIFSKLKQNFISYRFF